MSLKVTLATVLTLGLLAPAAFAQTSAPAGPGDQAGTAGLNARQRRQGQRIRIGEQRGTIDAAEARRLRAMERRLRTLEQQFRTSDGRLTARERVRLQRLLNRASRAIARAGRG